MANIEINLLKIAKSAALNIQPKEEEQFKNEIHAIVSMLTELQSVNTKDVEPLMSVCQGSLHMRQDITEDPQSDVLVKTSSNSMKYNYFIIPKFVD